MLAGTQILHNIDQNLEKMRVEIVHSNTQLSNLSNTILQLQQQRHTIIKKIAKIRLDELSSNEIDILLTEADKQALYSMSQRASALDELNHRIDKLNQDIRAIEKQRQDQLQQCNQTSQHLVEVESQVQKQLKSDEHYINQLNLAQQAEQISEEANSKVEQAKGDMLEKAKPYQKDTLFMYLWNRNYGTVDYSANLLSRFLDGFVAKTISYDALRSHYWNLTEIPKRLSIHAQAVQEKVNQQYLVLQQIEAEALSNKGAKKIEQALEKERQQLDNLDDILEKKEQNLNVELDNKQQYFSGTDEFTRRSIEILSKAILHNDVHLIERYVRQTHSISDDQMVVDLYYLADQIEDTKQQQQTLSITHQASMQRFKELQHVRRNFKNSRYDDIRSGFSNHSLITGALQQFLQGLVSSAQLWTVLKKNQYYRDLGSMPDFGSGSLGDIFSQLPRSGRTRHTGQRNSWSWPSARQGGSGYQRPRRSSGGFKTGGGF